MCIRDSQLGVVAHQLQHHLAPPADGRARLNRLGRQRVGLLVEGHNDAQPLARPEVGHDDLLPVGRHLRQLDAPGDDDVEHRRLLPLVEVDPPLADFVDAPGSYDPIEVALGQTFEQGKTGNDVAVIGGDHIESYHS